MRGIKLSVISRNAVGNMAKNDTPVKTQLNFFTSLQFNRQNAGRDLGQQMALRSLHGQSMHNHPCGNSEKCMSC